MTTRPVLTGQSNVMEESAEAVQGLENTRASTMWKIVATVVTILFVMLLLWVGSRLVWLGAS